MSMKFSPPPFPQNPSQSQWQWWRKCFIDGLTINEVTESNHKLTFLRSLAGPELFSLLADASDFDSALAILDAQFIQPTRILFARHQLLTARQKQEEKIHDFAKRLNILVESCQCKSLTATQHKESILRDALVAGIESDSIRASLLELEDGSASLSACLAKASAIELSSGFSKSFHNTFNTPNESVSAIQTEQNISEVCAISDKGIKPQFSRNSRNGTKHIQIFQQSLSVADVHSADHHFIRDANVLLVMITV